jgi:hypothetical protein
MIKAGLMQSWLHYIPLCRKSQVAEATKSAFFSFRFVLKCRELAAEPFSFLRHMMVIKRQKGEKHAKQRK